MLGKTDLKVMTEVISNTLKRRFVLKDKIAYDDEKSCLIFAAPPRLDAAFGVAFAVKGGEKDSETFRAYSPLPIPSDKAIKNACSFILITECVSPETFSPPCR